MRINKNITFSIDKNIPILNTNVRISFLLEMITIQGETCKPLDIVMGTQELKGYYISMAGRVFSTKRKQIREVRPFFSSKENRYKIVNLYHNSKYKRYYVHRLVSLAFKLNTKNGYRITHINGNPSDNRVENLIYEKEVTGYKRGEYKKKDRVKIVYLPPKFDLNENLIEEIKLLHKATQIKGMNVSNDVNDFFYEIMKGAMEEYKIKYNLNKILFSLKNDQS